MQLYKIRIYHRCLNLSRLRFLQRTRGHLPITPCHLPSSEVGDGQQSHSLAMIHSATRSLACIECFINHTDIGSITKEGYHDTDAVISSRGCRYVCIPTLANLKQNFYVLQTQHCHRPIATQQRFTHIHSFSPPLYSHSFYPYYHPLNRCWIARLHQKST